MRVIRGFLAGVAWGGVVAGLGLAVISQVAPHPVAPVAAVSVGGDAARPAVATTPGAVAVSGAPGTAAQGPEAPAAQPAATPPAAAPPVAAPPPEAGPTPVAVAPSGPEVAPPGPDAAMQGAAPPEVIAVAEAPAAPQADRPVASPAVPAALSPPAAAPAAPGALIAPQPAAPAAAPDLPPPAPDEVLLVPPPAPTIDPAPARIAPDPVPEPGGPGVPGASQPVPDTAPELPVARPLPLPAEPPQPAPPPEVAAVAPQAPDPAVPVPPSAAPGVGADAPRTLTPDPALPPAEGVTVGRLPRIGSQDAPDPAAAADAPTLEPPEDAPPLRRFARAFANDGGKPLFAVLLRDTGAADLDRAALAQIAFPVTFVIDPLAIGAAEAAAIYRGADQEVLMLATGIPQGATPGDLEQTFQSLAAALPQAVGVIDQASGGFQGNRPLASQVIPILAAQGRGLVTFDAGLNAADQEARRAALPSAMIFRRLDAEGEAVPTIRRYLDRAAFKAAQEGRVVVLGDTRPETVAALLEWAVEGRAAEVALAPISAVMSVP